MNIQIFGSSKSFDTKPSGGSRAPHHTIYRRPLKAIIPREYQSVKQKVGFEALVDVMLRSRAHEAHYRLTLRRRPGRRSSEHPEPVPYPIVRNGREATVGYRPEVWATWEGGWGVETASNRILSRTSEENRRGGWPMVLPKNRWLRGAYLMTQRYLRHNVGSQSAALAFYLLFMIFPLLIFISALLGLLQLDVAAILDALVEFLPTEVVSIVGMYLNYVGEDPSPQLLLFGLFFSIYFPMRATNTLMRAVRTAYHLGPPRAAVRHVIKTFLYTVVLIVTITVTLALMTVGDRLLLYAVENFHLPSFLAELWARLRFPVSAVAGYFALFFLYALAQDVRQPWRNIWPGTLAALGAWLALSWLYAFYVDNVAHYSLLYGSIGAVIVLLIWLYMSAATLILGAELNGTIMSLRKDGRGDA